VPSRSERSVRQRHRVQGWASAQARLRLFRPGGQAAWRNALERGIGIADEVANLPGRNGQPRADKRTNIQLGMTSMAPNRKQCHPQ
jgi:hypothetical protein